MISSDAGTNFSVYLQSFEKEAGVLKSITNLRNIGAECPRDVLDALKKVESVVNSTESCMNELERAVEADIKSLDENTAVLTEMVDKQRVAIDAMEKSDMPNFLKPMLNVGKAAAKYRPVEAAEFTKVPVSTRGRQTLVKINECFGCIYKLIAEKTENLGTVQGRKALGKGFMLEYDKLKHADHKGSVFLTEPELRGTAIFASGETTGRAVLHTLRALKRITVVRSNGENTFILC